MILPFSQYFDKAKQKETLFAEKINMLFSDTHDNHREFYDKLANEQINFMFFLSYRLNMNEFKHTPICKKIHTIRTDTKNRWKAGNKVHCVYNNRSKNQFQFAPTFECKGVQSITISYIDHPELDADIVVRVDGRKLSYAEIEQLAINDGFESGEHFFKWFNTNYKGKIIHFTDFMY